MNVQVITPVATEPILLADAKAHLRVDGTADDAYITTLITIARQQAEHVAERSFAPQTLRMRCDEWGDGIELRRGPVNVVSWVKYLDVAGVQQTLSASNYYLSSSSLVPVVRLAPGYRWPQIPQRDDAIEVQYTAGTWGESPRAALQYMLLLIGSMYEMREADAERAAARMPWVDSLLQVHSIPRG